MVVWWYRIVVGDGGIVLLLVMVVWWYSIVVGVGDGVGIVLLLVIMVWWYSIVVGDGVGIPSSCPNLQPPYSALHLSLQFVT